MKNTKDHFNRFFNQSNVRSFLFGIMVIFISVLFEACSNEEELKKESEVQKSTNLTKRSGVDLIEESATSFSQAILSNNDDLNYALNKNLYVGFNEQTMQMLNSVQNEIELKLVFEQAGIANSQEVMDILYSIVQAQQSFIDENPNFYTLTQQQQIEYLNTGIELAKNNYVNPNPITPTSSYWTSTCASAFNKSIDRCNGDFGTCAVFAVAGAYAGFAPGLLAAAYCMATKLSCDRRSKEDYIECLAPSDSGSGGLDYNNNPITETLHCDRDSCWATTLNGQYIRRVE